MTESTEYGPASSRTLVSHFSAGKKPFRAYDGYNSAPRPVHGSIQCHATSVYLAPIDRCHHRRTARVTPAMTKASDANCGNSSGSPSATAEAITPIIGVSSMPIAAVPASTRRNAANQVR
jgi:hypothetical protein